MAAAAARAMQVLAPEPWLARLLDPATRLDLPDAVPLGRWRLPDWRIPLRRIDDHLLYWLVRGTAEGQVAGQAVELSAGSAIWIMPEVEHRFARAAGSREVVLYNLRFDATLRGERFRLAAPWLANSRSVDLEGVFANVTDEIQAPGAFGATMLKALVAELIARVLRAADPPTGSAGGAAEAALPVLSRFQRDTLARYVEAHLAERPTPAELARHLKLSPDYFTRIFRRTYRLPPRGWLLRQRIRLAAQRLAQSTRQVSEVARELGYSDVYLFSRQFKKVMGVSPRAHRRRAT
ncbi:MAG: AraC family transcriptional regulator [Planctomycetota bacterium]